MTFDANGGEVDMESKTINPNSNVGELPVPWKWDHVFKGWFTAAEGGTQVTAKTVVTGDMTLYAQWEAANYEWSYEDNYDGGITITGVSPLAGGITIPSEIDDKRVTSIGDRVFSNESGLKGVIIPEGVLSVQALAFFSCTALETVVLPSTLTVIDDRAFYECAVATITIPAEVGIIGWHAFGRCTNLSTITFEGDESSIDIDGSAFKNTALPFSLVVNEGVLIGYRGECPTNLVIGDYVNGVSEIGDSAFLFDGILSITIPSSVTNIHREAFYECQNLSEVVFLGDKDDIDIHESAFAGTPYEASLPFELIIREGVLTGFTGACPKELTIPNSVSVIGSSVFYRSQHPSVDNLERVVFNEGLGTIGDMSFFNCYNLKEILLPSTVTNIEYDAFGACYSVTNIVLNEGLLSIQNGAFGDGTTANITLPTTVREVNREAFRGTEGTVTVHAPWSLWGILDSGDVYQEYWSDGSYVTTTRVDVVFYGDAPDFYTITFNENGGCNLYETEKSVMDGREIGIVPVPTHGDATLGFMGWYTATNGGALVVPQTIVSSNATLYAHWGVVLPELCYRVDEDADGNLGVWITRDACYYYSDLAGDLVIPSQLAMEIGGDGCYSLPVVGIDDYAFSGTAMTSVDIPYGVVSIGEGVFNDCYYMASVMIPSSVTNIGETAFAGCYGLTNIIFLGNAPAVGSYCFYGAGSGSDAGSCTAYVSQNSTGWGVDIPGTWKGINIEYIDEPTLTEALDNAALAFSTGGESGWIGVADGTANGGDSIRSGIVPSYGYTSYFDTTVTNRGTLSFWYKVSGGTGDNLFAYRVDSDRRSLMAGRTNGTDGAWIQETCCITNDGAHLVRWIYYPYEASGSDLASDCAWVDQVEWSPLFTFDGNGGTPAASNINYVAGRTYGTMPNVSRVGYLMTGWFTSPDGGTQVISTQTVPGVGATYYAHWTPKTYVIRFNANGGTGTMADMAMTYDAAGNLPANGFSRAGYTFAGWAVSASGHAVYADGAGVANLSSTQGAVVTLYAVWRTSLAEAVDNVAIGFSSATGWTGVADPTAYGGNSAQSGMVSYGQTSFMDTAVTNRGTLSFRYKVSGGRGGDLFAYRVDSERKSLTAGRTNGTDGEWIQETCCITNDGVHLVRWVYYPYEYTGVDVTNDCACIDQVAWSPLFTFDGNGGTPAVSNISYVAGNTYGTMPNASRTGYLMTGWFTAPEGGTQVISTYTVPNVGATYYAHWRENTHGATYDVNIGGKTVAVPQAWIAGHPALVDAAGGDAVAALNSAAANGRMSVVECYVVGVDPEKADEDFKITSLPMKADGTPDLANIAFTPARETWNVPEATPVLKGAERLEGEWQTVTEENKEAFRFFKVVVEVP